MLSIFVDFIFIFFVVWWIAIFLVLPFFANRDESPESGNDAGAPKNLNLRKIFIATTILSLIISVCYLWAVKTGVIDLQKLAEF